MKVKIYFNLHFKNLCKDSDIDWKAIYKLPQKTAYNTYMRSFQYKILDNIIFLNKKLFIFEFEVFVYFAIWKMKHLCTCFPINIL